MTRYDVFSVLAVVLTLALLGAIVCTSMGLFAKPYGLYVEMHGVSIGEGAIAFSHVYAVVEDRRPGPDRTIAVFQDAGQAWYYMRTYPMSPAREDGVQRAGG